MIYVGPRTMEKSLENQLSEMDSFLKEISGRQRTWRVRDAQYSGTISFINH